MSPKEAAGLLTLAASFDRRKPDADAARAWALALDGITYADAQAAIVKHFRSSDEWLMPQHVIAGAKRIRRERIDAYGTLPDPPSNIDPDDTEALIAWQADTVRRIGDGEDVQREMPGNRSLDMAAVAVLMPSPARGDDVHEHAASARAAIRGAQTRAATRDARGAGDEEEQG